MSVGSPISKDLVDNLALSAVRTQYQAVSQIQGLKQWLDTQTDQNLIDLGYTAGEVAVLKSAIGDLADLSGIFQGSATAKTLPYDYRTFAKQILGPGYRF